MCAAPESSDCLRYHPSHTPRQWLNGIKVPRGAESHTWRFAFSVFAHSFPCAPRTTPKQLQNIRDRIVEHNGGNFGPNTLAPSQPPSLVSVVPSRRTARPTPFPNKPNAMSTDTVPIERAKPNWSAKDESKIRRVFEQCDEDSSGTVSLAELFSGLAKDKQLSRTLGIPPDASVDNKEQLEAIFAGLDTDGNAELDFEEFGYFFAERVEVLRYLPTTDGDATQCVLEADLEQIVRQKQPEVVPAFETCIAAELAAAGVTAGSEIYAELKGTAYTNVSKFVDAYRYGLAGFPKLSHRPFASTRLTLSFTHPKRAFQDLTRDEAVRRRVGVPKV